MPQPPGPFLALDNLVRQAVAGDRDAFGHLYERYVDRIYRYIYFLTSGSADVEDLTAQTFLQAWQKIGRFQPRGPSSFGPWLLRIAHNLSVSHLRRRHNGTLLPDDYPDTAPAADPTQQLLEGSDAARLRAAILELTPMERNVIVLRFVDGLSYGQTAETLGRKVNTVRVAQFRALGHLRAILEGMAGGVPTFASKKAG